MSDASLNYNIDMMNVSSDEESVSSMPSPLHLSPASSWSTRSSVTSSSSSHSFASIGFSSFGSSSHTSGNSSQNTDADSVGLIVTIDDSLSLRSASFTTDSSGGENSPSRIDIPQIEANINQINLYCSQIVARIGPDTSGARTSTPRIQAPTVCIGFSNNRPVEVIDLSYVHEESGPRTAANVVPEAVIDLCSPNGSTIVLDDSVTVPTNRRRSHDSSSTPTTASAMSVGDDSGPSSPKRKRNDNNNNKQSDNDIYHCPVCLERPREPFSTVCGHVFCGQCIDAAIRATHKCPLCNKKLNLRQKSRIYL